MNVTVPCFALPTNSLSFYLKECYKEISASAVTTLPLHVENCALASGGAGFSGTGGSYVETEWTALVGGCSTWPGNICIPVNFKLLSCLHLTGMFLCLIPLSFVKICH